MLQKYKAFTLVELIVVITILAILATIGYTSLIGYQLSARDSTRISDIKNISKVIELTRLDTGNFPSVTNPINVTFSGSVIWKQGSFGVDSRADSRRLSDLPVDPLTQSEYAYSTTTSTAEYQLGAILEGGIAYNNPIVGQTHAVQSLHHFSSAFIRGNYNGRFITHTEEIDQNTNRVYVLGVPSILATNTADVTIEDILTNNSLIYPGKRISPSTYSGSVSRDNDWTFTPQITPHGTSHSSIAVIYEGTSDELSTGTGKINLVDSLKTYYASSGIQTEDSIEDFIDIDTGTDPNEAITLVNTFIQADLGGLESTKSSTTEVASSGGGGGGGGGGPVNCTDMSAADLANLNGWANIVPGRGGWADALPGTSSLAISDWCAITSLNNFGGLPTLPPEIGLLNLQEITFDSSGLTALPDEFADLADTLYLIDFSGNPGLGNLANYFEDVEEITSTPAGPWDYTCQPGATTSGAMLCIGVLGAT